MRFGVALWISAAAVAAWTTLADAQTAPLQQLDVKVFLDSGTVQSPADGRTAVFSGVVETPGMTWLRLTFDEVVLGDAPRGSDPTVLRLTSLLDGAVQTLDWPTLLEWKHTSAYFNGDAVRVEIIADPGAAPSRVKTTHAWAGTGGSTILGDKSICGPTDDRELSDDPRAARVVPIGCTVWMINDYNHCFLTAGHCIASGFQVVEFNVPLSDPYGGLVHPEPKDQYSIDDASIQTNYGQGVGNDWAYFGCFENSETGKTPYQAQGDYYMLAMPPTVIDQQIRITGYGTTSPPVPDEWNQVQKTHVGPFVTSSGSTLGYATDTTGGNSGSPVINEDTGQAIGIHTHGGCDYAGENSGTGANHPGLQDALANPQGVCIPQPPVGFTFPDGLPEWIHPAGDSIRVHIFGQFGGEPEAGTGMLHYDAGAGFVAVPLQFVSDDLYDAVFPPLECGIFVPYYFSAESIDGEIVTDPMFAPTVTYEARAIAGVEFAFADDFETDLGWTVEDSFDLTEGSWDRGVPIDDARGDPPTDADGSGKCYVTGNSDDEDIDDGTTTLISPLMDASDPESVIAYHRWYSNTYGADPENDTFVIDVSDDGGSTWTTLEKVGPSGPEVDGGWYYKEFTVADIPNIVNSDQFRIRFIASDLADGSVVEAAVDGVQIKVILCGDQIGDIDGDGDVDVEDLLALLAAWGPCEDCPEDLNGDGAVDVMDLLLLLGNWT